MRSRFGQLLRISVGGKVRAGLAVLIVLGAGIGAVGLNGLTHLGYAVEETATAATVLSGVNTAGSSVSSFIISHDPKEILGALTALGAASKAATSLKSSDQAELEALTKALDRFITSLTRLQSSANEMDTATQTMADASKSLVELAQKAEETSIKAAEEADKNITNIQIDQDNIRNVAIAASKIQASSFAIREAMTRYALGNPPADLELARKAANEMVEPADLITRMAGWPAHQKIVAELTKASKDIIAALDPKIEGTVDAFGILKNSNSTIASARDLINALAADIDANAEHTRTSGDDASKARVVAGLARNFSDRIRIASTTADQYRISPSDDKVEAVNKALKTAGSFAKMLQKFNYPELGPGVIAAVNGFQSLSAAKPKFDAAVTEARSVSTEASALIAKLTEDRRINAASQSQSSLTMIGVTGAAAILFAIAVAFFLTRSIVGPIRALTGSMLRLASGDITSTIPEVKQSDEIGEMTKAIHVFRDNARERQELSAASEREQAARTERQRRIEGMIENFRSQMSSVLESVSGSADRMQETAQLLTGIAQESSGQAASAGIASSEASSSVETVAASAEELSSSITEISHQVKGARDIVSKTSENAAATDARTSGLVEAAGKIGNVVQLIRQVAEQTNLLALNATIEAARAGEAGRGFAVVAGEVKALANQTSRATDEIAAQIKAIQEATGTVVESIRDISRNMTEVSSYTESISSAVGQQSAATGEIARSVVRAADGTRAASSSVETLSRSVDETSQSAAAVLSVSHELNQQAATVTNMVESFLREVAAA